MVRRKEREKDLHDRACADIAKARFNFPNTEHPTWKTFVNEPEQMMGVPSREHPHGDTMYPDVVVVETQKNTLEMLGEIETESSVNQEETKQWTDYSTVCETFYLYVPKGYGPAAKRLLTDNKIRYPGLREYSYDAQGKIAIANVA